MKKDSVTVVLVVLLLIGGVSTFGLTVLYELHMRSLRRMGPELMRAQAIDASIRQLLVDSYEYSKRNPAILPVLQGPNVQTQPGGSTQQTRSQQKTQTR